MKKKIMKLSLSRETLHCLSTQDVNQAAGGVRTIFKGTCEDCTNNTCLTCNTCNTCPDLTCRPCPI